MQNSPPVDPNAPTWPGAASPRPQPAPRVYPQMQAPRRSIGVRQITSRLSFGLSELVAVALGVVEIGLLLRIILLYLAANPSAGFTSWVYSLTYPLVAPFARVFPNLTVAGGVLETAALLAMLVYALLARIVESILRLLARL